MEYLNLQQGDCSARICTYGAQILSCQLQDAHPLLWLSSAALYQPGQSIRGGVPICWPWFGRSPKPGRPAQGFARLVDWQVQSVQPAQAVFRLTDADVPPEMVDFPFRLQMSITLNGSLSLALEMVNLGFRPAVVSCALHTYLAVSNYENVCLTGLDNREFTVKDNPQRRLQEGPLHPRGEICSLFHDIAAPIVVHDPAWHRRITLHNRGSNTALVWNPGRQRAGELSDIGENNYQNLLCVEANNASEDARILLPLHPHCLSQTISIAEP